MKCLKDNYYFVPLISKLYQLTKFNQITKNEEINTYYNYSVCRFYN